MGVTLTFFNELGKFPCIRDLLTIKARKGDNILENYFYDSDGATIIIA